MQITVGNRRMQQFGQCNRFLHAIGEYHPSSGKNDGKLRLGEYARRFVECNFITGATTNSNRLRNLDFDVTVEKVARNVQLRRAHLEQRPIEATRRNFRDALRVHHMPLILGDLRKDGSCSVS